jgi:predicted metal-dependent peptidase
MKKISDKQHNQIYNELKSIDELFAEMWKSQERMVLDDNEDGACLEIFNNNFRMVANPSFWKRCNRHKKIFIICHELCHVAFGHWLIDPKSDREWMNIAQDIQVNEFLFNYYYFTQELIRDNSCITLALVFKHKAHLVEKNKDSLYYYKLLMQCLK